MRTLRMAIRGLTNDWVRTTLTTLGIIIGIATVIVVFSVGEGFKGYVTAQIEAYGSNTVFVETRVPPTTKAIQDGTPEGLSNANQVGTITTLKHRDLEDILKLPNVKNAYGAAIGQKVVNYRNVSKNSIIFGSDESRFEIDPGQLAVGRPYTAAENASAAQVAVLGRELAEDLFGQSDPLGKFIRVGDLNFTVIGVYEDRGTSFGLFNENQQVFVPLFTAQKKLLGIDHLFYAVVQLENQDLAAPTAEDMRILLRQNHSITDPAKDDFLVTTQAEGLETLDTILNAVRFLLVAIAAISLIVGGVGIMNIMYVVVTERISEIGLKKALGATKSAILTEFLLEAVLVTMLGGIIGIIVGSGVSFGIAQIANLLDFDWKFVVPISGIILGVGVSMSIGIIFGVFPARKAAKLDPIAALNHE